jgi:hypothetical protein
MSRRSCWSRVKWICGKLFSITDMLADPDSPKCGRTWCRGNFWMPPATHLRTQRPKLKLGKEVCSLLWWGHLTYWLGLGMWGTTGTELSPSVGTSRSAAALPLSSHPPSWQGFQPSVWASEKSFPNWQKHYASPEATWSSLLAWGMDVFSCAHKELFEPRWSCSYWLTSLKPLCCGSSCGCSYGYGLLLSPTWTPRLANVTNGVSRELFNDPLFINIMSKLI